MIVVMFLVMIPIGIGLMGGLSLLAECLCGRARLDRSCLCVLLGAAVAAPAARGGLWLGEYLEAPTLVSCMLFLCLFLVCTGLMGLNMATGKDGAARRRAGDHLIQIFGSALCVAGIYSIGCLVAILGASVGNYEVAWVGSHNSWLHFVIIVLLLCLVTGIHLKRSAKSMAKDTFSEKEVAA